MRVLYNYTYAIYRPLPSTDMQAEMTDPPPYQYPRHLTDLVRLSEDEITLEPAALSAYM